MNDADHPLPELPLFYDPKLAPNGALIFDNSTLELLKCPRLLEYKWLRKRELVANRAGRNFGSGMHIGWAERYRRCGTNAVDDMAAIEINDAMRKFFEESPAPGEDFRNYHHAERVMAAYNSCYRNEPFEILKKPDGSPVVEASFLLPFDFEIDGHPLYYSGKIDTGIRDASGIWSFDHKTAFQFGDTFDAQMHRDGGQLGYAWALSKAMNEKPCGYIIDAVRIRKPSRKSEYSGEAPVDSTDFNRMPFALSTPDILETWHRDVCELVTLIVGFHKRGYFPEYRWNCVNKYGKCDFFEACSCPPAQRMGVLYHTTLFTESDWSPLNSPTPSE